MPQLTNVKSIRAKLVGLLIECHAGGNPEACPLHEKRNLSFAERVAWLKSLRNDEIFSIYAAYRDCMEARASASAST